MIIIDGIFEWHAVGTHSAQGKFKINNYYHKLHLKEGGDYFMLNYYY